MELSSLLGTDVKKLSIHLFKDGDAFHNKDIGIELLTNDGIIHTAIVTRKYKGCLPDSLSWNITNQHIISIYGDTPKKGGGTIPVWLAYDNLGLQFEFLGKNWKDDSNPLMLIMVYKRSECWCNLLTSKDISKYDGACSVCLKKPCILFCKCNRIFYCSKKCQEVFANYHSKYCLLN
jgi:hypothetical protein